MTPLSPPRFPVNKIIAFLGPYLAIVSGAAAAWLGQHFPGLDLNVDGTAGAIMQTSEFAIGALVTWALHHKYLAGWQQWERGLQAIQLAQVVANASAPPTAAAQAAAAFDVEAPAWSPGAFGAAQNGTPATQNGAAPAAPSPAAPSAG